MADRLIDTAWRILLEVGPDSFTLDRLAAEAHASKQTIYARFSGKAELLSAVLARRVDLMTAEMTHFCRNGTAEEAFVDLAYRLSVSLAQPDAALVDRLLDWIDAHTSGSGPMATRLAVNETFQALMVQNLNSASECWEIQLEDISVAATFWIDGMYGHVRGMIRSQTEHRAWARNFGRMYLRAIRRPN